MRRTRKVKANPPATFVPVHAASMSTPIFAGMVREFGEPDLNPDIGEDILFADELAEKYRPVFSMRECLPSWVQDTGIYLLNSAWLEQFRSTLPGDKEA